MRIGAATANIAGDRALDLVECRIGTTRERGGDRHHHAGRAETALERIFCKEGGLHRMHPIIRAESLDSRNRARARIDREHQARYDRRAIEEDGAGAAGTTVANKLGAGKA